MKSKRLKVAPFKKGIVVPVPAELRSPVVYFGGKLRDAWWVIKNLPPHKYYVEVFGGGAAVIINKPPSQNDIYNDLGNVAVFWKVLKAFPEELYEALYTTHYSRSEFEECHRTWEEYARKSRETGDPADYVEFARRWFVQTNISYSHTENDASFKVATQVNNAVGFRNHVDLLPYVADRFRSICIEHRHFRDVFDLYDRTDTLFYCDPPYVEDSRVSLNTYRCEMSLDEQRELLDLITHCKGQVVLSGYDNDLYNEALRGWRTVRRTMPSAIQNRSQLEGRNDRTEVLWIREHDYGLWSLLSDEEQAASSSMASIQIEPEESELQGSLLLSE